MVTLKDMAREVNKSITTVSRALAGYSDVSPETIALVRDVAKKMGYVPNATAKMLQGKRTKTIGIVFPQTSGGYSEPFFSEFLAGIGETASAAGYDLLVSYAKNEPELDVYKRLVQTKRVDGFVINRTLCNDPRVNYLVSQGFPLSMFGRVCDQGDIPFVDEDGESAMRQIVDHLVERRHRCIACICPPESVMFSALRLAGFRQRLQFYDIPYIPELVRTGCFTEKDAFETTLELLALPYPPTAVVAFSDMMAFGAIGAIREKNLVVGKDVAVTGFDDIPLASYFQPSLTTIHQPIHHIGSIVTQFLLRQLGEGEQLSLDTTSNQIVLEPQLIIREST